MFSSPCFREERIEGVISSTDGFVAGHLAIRLYSVFQTEQFPTGIANLDTSLTNVDAKGLTHLDKGFDL
jgi:hypothetical protein